MVRSLKGKVNTYSLGADETDDLLKLIDHRLVFVAKLFLIFFQNVMFKFSGTKTLFNNNGIMVILMATLQAAYDEVTSDEFDYMTFRRAILDSHNYIKQMFEGGVGDAKLTDSTANR